MFAGEAGGCAGGETAGWAVAAVEVEVVEDG